MNIACPICNSQDSKEVYKVRSEGRDYSVKTCSECEHLYTWFDFDLDEEGLYSDDVYQIVDNRDSVYSKIMSYEYGKVLKRLNGYFEKESALLDFGAGKGVFLNLAKNYGFRVSGVETAEARADFAEKKYGLDIMRTIYQNGKIGSGNYDIITLFHVLEHLPRPLLLLKNLISENLRANGMLVIEVPNLSSFQSRIATSKWMHLDIPRHLSHFSKKRLKDFCEELDLKIVKTEYFSLHLGVLGMCHSILSLFGYQGKIIADLKRYNKKLMLALVLVLPVAFIVELAASVFNRGGILRVYCRRLG